MKKIVILGAGTAGTMMLNKLHNILDKEEWELTIVDQYKTHYYQPGFLFIPFGVYNRQDVSKPKYDFFPSGVNVIFNKIDKIEGENNRVFLDGGKILNYDFLIIFRANSICFSEVESSEYSCKANLEKSLELFEEAYNKSK